LSRGVPVFGMRIDARWFNRMAGPRPDHGAAAQAIARAAPRVLRA
jgi:hypothetical protein